MDATLVTSFSDKEGAAPTWKKGYGFHPLGAWCRNTRECLAMLLRPGNAGSNTFTDHKEVLAAAMRQVPVPVPAQDHGPRRRRRCEPRPRRATCWAVLPAPQDLLFTCGWMIIAADEDAIRLLPAGAWKPGTAQDGSIEEDKDAAEITQPDDQRGELARRAALDRPPGEAVPPPDAQPHRLREGNRLALLRRLHEYPGLRDRRASPAATTRSTSTSCTASTPCVETAGVRTAKAMGLRGLPSRTWQVNAGWVIAANIAADLAAWTRLLGHAADPELRDADPDTLRYRVWHLPARLARPRSPAHPRHQPRLALGRSVPCLLAAPLRSARTRLTSTNRPHDTEGGPPRRGRSRCAPGHPGIARTTRPEGKRT